MSVNDKRMVILNYCERTGCSKCVLRNKWIREDGEGCMAIATASEEELDLAWDLISEIHCDSVNHPSHYQGKHECIDEMVALFGVEAVKHFCMCNVYKYRFRAANKNGQEDLDKADWYMDKLMELEREKHD